MARQTDDNTRPVMLTADAARRIAKAVQAYEQGRTNIKAKPLRTAGDDSEPSVRIGKTQSEWPVGTIATIDLYEDGTPPDESYSGTLADCVNKFATVNADAWVAVALAANGHWYLIAAQCGDTGSGSS